jgi:penicillin-binding protein 2
MKRFLRSIRFSIRGKYRDPLVEPDEIFLDAKNLPDFDTQQFEGQLERPIERTSVVVLGIAFAVISILFASRLWTLQVADGSTYAKQSQNNSLSREPIFSARGNIYDRNGVLLAWNDTKTDDEPWGRRTYIASPGFSHVLGYVSYPAKDKSGNYWKTDIVGKDGVERMYNSLLSGTNGSHIVERDIAGKVSGGAIVNQPEAGKNLTLTIDSRLQAHLHQYLAEAQMTSGFRSGSAVMMNVHTGEVLAMTSTPEYDSNVMSMGEDTAKIRQYLTSSSTPLLNRAIAGLFTPGSIVKPYVALEVLNQKVIDPRAVICSCGSITVPNPYDPAHPGVFRDYNPNNGYVDMRKALAISSNIYFFETGGGYQNQKGIGIANIGKALERFGLTKETGIDLFGETSGTVPSPEWKAKKFNGEVWRIGDTYNTAIGQYGVQVTPLEMARAVAGIATRGTLVQPRILKTDTPPVTEQVTDVPDASYTVVHEGMRMGALEGTGRILASMPFAAATKTGTAQVGPGGMYVNAWMNAFFPYENPNYVLIIVLERGPQNGLGASQHVAKNFLDWVELNAPEYTK